MSTINVKKLGAQGDGIANDYPAFKRARDLINSRGYGELFIPPGTYYFEDYVNTNTTREACDAENFEKNIDFRDCRFIKISGYDAIIKMNGHFTRDPHWTDGSDQVWFSGVNALRFGFINCENIIVEGIEIDGGVNDTVRGVHIDSGGKQSPIAEYHGYGIYVKNQKTSQGGKPLKSLDIHNVYVHHCSTDGLGLNVENEEGLPVGRASITNSVFDKNARLGMHIRFGHNIVIDNCKFTDSGYQHYDAGYGHHAPGAGVDLESYGTLENGENPIKKIRFSRCEFKNNHGGQFMSNTVTEEISVEDSYFEDPYKGTAGITQGIRLSGRNITLKNNIVIGDITLFAGNDLEERFPHYREELGIHILYNRIYSNRHGIRAYSDASLKIVPVRIEGNYFQMLDNPVIDTSAIDCFPLINDAESVFVGNFIKIHPNRYQGGNPEIVARVQECKLVTNNVWDVLGDELEYTGDAFFKISYVDSNVFNESFPETVFFETIGYGSGLKRYFIN